MSQPVQPITQQECRQRLYTAVCDARTGDAVSPQDCAEWITALLSLAAFLGDVPLDRNLRFVEAAADLMLHFKQETAGSNQEG